ncbi:hypothetical protein WME99_06960 [Sorangium sp. So ce136]|uniref:hypothetical protein n=1 Tax=Sorangium sp. So ce136 TaxID=3133284 RepID=UPI003F0F111E
MYSPDQLPPIGTEIPCSIYSVNVPFLVHVLGVVTLDFKGGIKVRVEENNPSGPGGVKMRVIGFEVSAASPVLGKVTMTTTNSGATPLSQLDRTGKSPPTLRDTWVLDLQVTIEKPPGGGPPWVLSSTRPAKVLQDNLTVYPAQGAVYQLQQPVDLAPVGSPGQVAAQLQQWPITVSHNP